MTETGCVLVFGAAGIDTLARAALRAHESVPGSIVSAPGGVACNVALNLARLGVRVSLVSRVGDDDEGRRILREIAEAGVVTEHLSAVEGASTARYIALLGDDGDMRMAVSSMDIVETLTAADVEALKADRNAAKAVIADANLATETLRAVLAPEGPAIRCVDAVSAAKAGRIRNLLADIDILKTTPAEAAQLTGVDAGCAHQLCEALLEAGVGSVYLSDGARGLTVATLDGLDTLPPLAAANTRSTSGAGDALLAGIVLGRLIGDNAVDAGRLGLAAAALTLESASSTLTSLSRDLLVQTRKQHATDA